MIISKISDLKEEVKIFSKDTRVLYLRGYQQRQLNWLNINNEKKKKDLTEPIKQIVTLNPDF